MYAQPCCQPYCQFASLTVRLPALLYNQCASLWQCHKNFWHFLLHFYWVPAEQVKKFSLKNSFSRRYSRNKCFESPKLANTARSQTLHRLTLSRIKQFILLLNISISRESRIHLLIFRNIFENFSKIQN